MRCLVSFGTDLFAVSNGNSHAVLQSAEYLKRWFFAFSEQVSSNLSESKPEQEERFGRVERQHSFAPSRLVE